MQKDKNPAFAFCQAKAFLAYRDGKPVGRIQAILNDRANATFGKKYMNFTQVDFIDDDEVVDALFDTVESWARELGCYAMHGPLGFSDMDAGHADRGLRSKRDCFTPIITIRTISRS